MSEACGYWSQKEALEGEHLVETMELCGRDVEVTYVDPLDGFRYPLCHRHNGKDAQKAAEKLSYVAEYPPKPSN